MNSELQSLQQSQRPSEMSSSSCQWGRPDREKNIRSVIPAPSKNRNRGINPTVEDSPTRSNLSCCPGRSESGVNLSEERRKREEVRILKKTLEDLNTELRITDSSLSRYRELLNKIIPMYDLLDIRSQSITDFEQIALQAEQNYKKAIFDPRCDDDERTRLYEESIWARKTWEEVRKVTETAEAKVSEQETEELFMNEVVDSGNGPGGLLGWSMYMTGKTTVELNLAAKLKVDMPDVYIFDVKRHHSNTNQHILPDYDKECILLMSTVREVVRYSKSKLTTIVPGPPEQQPGHEFDIETAFEGNRDGMIINYDPKHYLLRMFEMFRSNAVSYRLAAQILMSINRLDTDVREAIKIDRDTTKFKHIFTPLCPNADIKTCFERFKDVCVYLMDLTVFVPTDKEIRGIIRDLHVPTTSMKVARSVWVKALEWDSLLRTMARNEEYYVDMWENCLRDQPSLREAYDRKSLQIAWAKKLPSGDMKSTVNISIVIHSLVESRAHLEDPPGVIIGNSLKFHDVGQRHAEEEGEDQESENDREHSQAAASARLINHEPHARSTNGPGEVLRANRNEIERRMNIPEMEQRFSLFDETTPVDSLPMLSWTEQKTQLNQQSNMFNLESENYACRLCGRKGHCHLDCKSRDLRGKLNMVNLFYRDGAWKDTLNKTLKSASIFKGVTIAQRDDIFRKMQELSARHGKRNGRRMS